MCALYIQPGRYGPAIADFNRALDLDPSYMEAYRGLGDAYLAQQRYDDARQAYHQYLDAAGQPGPDALLHYIRTWLYPFGIAGAKG